ncbi:carbohydrate ABC transporter membrane protein 1, CUT1 family [Faunimonas pinastri]|uniref:Carbohydrate ABC transporter membrane protein 1, CUT1 family n=1 Tax=Faunimonas pinastri TaxID=1855383 RepID=A0A1H9PCB1_9HYPH|nr:sugar ABC transporter permease [Faunimonas pinastri]SER45555.1 carbohydrate ABC transporter membrane protein 1, CUT1 family [Faunimonas pinastri]
MALSMTRDERKTPLEAWVLMAPALAILAVITFYPLLRTLYFSFTDAQISAAGTSGNFVGFDNYAYAASDAGFHAALIRTIVFTVSSVALETVMGVAVALLLNQEFKGRAIARTAIILPWAVPNIVNAMMWRLIMNPEYGALNAALTQTGILGAYRSWLGDPSTALAMVIFADVWKNFPLVAFVALAALQTVPSELYEAARIDGAGPWSRFRFVTLPGIVAPLLVAIVLRSIEAFRVFDIIYVMTRGGPIDSTKTVSFYVYQTYFSYLDAGTGAAYAVIVALLSAVMISGYILVIRRQEAK